MISTASGVRLNDCLWIRSQNVEGQPVFLPLLKTMEQRGMKVWRLEDCSAGSIARLRQQLSKSDQHVILQGLLGKEMQALRPVFESRKNFSVLPIDWWNSPYWFTRNATYLLYHNYNCIAARIRPSFSLNKDRATWLFTYERRSPYAVMSAVLRPPALLAAPFINLFNQWRRQSAPVDRSRLLYFPFAITADQVPLQSLPSKYDFTNMGATTGPWLMRDPYTSAWLNFANLYSDRKRLADMIARFDGQPFKVYDRRRNYAFLPWEELNRIIRESRFMICTGGLHQNSVPKFLEYACLGVPMIGATLPFEYPWLDQCLFPLDAMKISSAQLKPKLIEALELQPKLRDNCLTWRDTLLKMYNPERLLDLLQDQIDGKPIPPGYLKDSIQ